jgi:hypothetical protein
MPKVLLSRGVSVNQSSKDQMNTIPDAKRSSWSVAFNLGLLFNLLNKWSVLTIIFVAVISGYNAYYLTREYGLKPAEVAISIIGTIAAWACLKAMMLMMTYPVFNKTRFEGSLFIMALLVALLLEVAIGSASILAAPRIDTFPTAELTWMLPLVYAVCSIFFFAAFHLFHGVFKRKLI